MGEPPRDPVPLEFGSPVEWNGALLTAYPASHIVGAAQLLVEYRGERLVYTGDIKLREPLCGASTEVVACDRLIIESTFGLPIFHFLSREEARERILAFARSCFDDGIIPAFLGYPLGRGQEIAHVLCDAGIPAAVHGSIARYIPAYEREGYRCANWQSYDRGSGRGTALVAVPAFANVLEARVGKYRVAYVSGWAAMDNARARARAEELIPYSDHADFDELIAIVERSGAREVDVVHGYAEPFARILHNRGIVARSPFASAARTAVEDIPEG
jgi:Cft2 family RNA processing exonuclease